MDSNTKQFYTDLLTKIKQRLWSAGFKERHRSSEKAFSRKRTLTFSIVVLFLLNMVKRSIQDELDEFFKAMNGSKIAARIVTKSAFCQARHKLKHEAFIELNQVQVAYYYEAGQSHRWHGFRLLAIDGSMSDLPNNEATSEHFGVWHPQSGGTCAKARLSQVFDVQNKITIEALIAPKSVDERTLAAQHLAHVGTSDLLLMDRGYPAFWLFAAILEQEADFCVRMTVSEWKAVQKFVRSGQKDQYVLLRPGYAAKKKCLAYGLPTDPIRVRLVRVKLPTDEIEVLATSLLDRTHFPASLFQALYHERWPVEEDYKTMKSRLEVENWSGQSVQAIYQEFHASVFTKNLAAILACPAQQIVTQQSQQKKHLYQINLTNLLSKMKDSIVWLLTESDLDDLLHALWQQMVKTTEPIRPGRSYSRQQRVKRKRFPLTYKAIR